MTERSGYYAEQNALAMAHAITGNPEITDPIQAYEFFCKCINEKPSYATMPEGAIVFRLNGGEIIIQDDERRLDPLVEVIERIFFELYYSKQK